LTRWEHPETTEIVNHHRDHEKKKWESQTSTEERLNLRRRGRLRGEGRFSIKGPEKGEQGGGRFKEKIGTVKP